MRVVAVAHYYLPANRGGAELMLHALLVALADAGHEVTVLATEGPAGEHTVDGVRVVSGPRSIRGLRTIRPEVCVSHLKEVSRVAPWAARERVPLVQVVHSTHRWIGRDVARGAALFVFNADHVAVHYEQRVRGPALVVHPPVWAGRHATTPGDRVTLVNLIPEKGSDVFYDLAARMPDVEFLGVVGGYEVARQDIRDLPNVAIQDHTPDMRTDVWASTRVLLMPSEHESYGMVAVEAAASGIPTIAHPTEGLREALGDAGTFVDRGDVDAWEKTLRDLLSPSAWGAASQLARSRSAELDPRKELAEWVATVESL